MEVSEEDRIRAAERVRIAGALRRYFDDGPGTFRALIGYLELDYRTALLEGWLDTNNAIFDHGDAIFSGTRQP